MFDDLLQYVIDDALIIIPMLWFVGFLLKSTPKVSDWLIPYILTLLGVVTTCALLGVSAPSIIQGVLVSGAAVLGNAYVKQYNKRGDSDE